MEKLIVNADDLGLSEELNKGILKAYTDGILTSASIVANGQAFDHAVALVKSAPSLDVGVHLTLIDEKPVLPPEKIPSLVNSSGRMHPDAFSFTKRYFLGKISLDEAKVELENQVERILQTGINPSHLDSHQHLHMLPGVLDVVIELSLKYDIPAIRFPRETISFAKLRSVSLPRIAQTLVLNLFCRAANTRIKTRTDSFAGFMYGGNLNKKSLLTIVKNVAPDSLCEIMCHPGLDDPQSPYSHWGYQWGEELNALLDPEVISMVHKNGIELTTYAELSGNGEIYRQKK